VLAAAGNLGWAYTNPTVGPTANGVELIWHTPAGNVHALLSEHGSQYLVLRQDQTIADRGSISDLGFFARNVLKPRLPNF
jgi:hypothetical protein